MSAVPLMLASGPGAESREVIGVVIFFGVAFSAVLTLFIIPMAYYWLARNTGSPLAVTNELQRLAASEVAPEVTPDK